MQRSISVHEAIIKTATVEIKSLRIGARQMTLSVFRQLVNEDLISSDTGELLGVPWGLVNYFWQCCDADRTASHLHVVWQKGDCLRRACVWEHRLSNDDRDLVRWREQYCLECIAHTQRVKALRDALNG